MFIKKYLTLSIIGGFLSCISINASRQISSIVGKNYIEDFREHLCSIDKESIKPSLLGSALCQDPDEVEKLIREYKENDYKILSSPINIDLLYEIILLTNLADRETFVLDAFELKTERFPENLTDFNWNDFKNYETVEEFIRLIDKPSDYVFSYSFLYSLCVIPKDRLKIFVTMIGQYIIKTDDNYDSIISDIAKQIIFSSNPYSRKTASPETLARDKVLKLSNLDGQTIAFDDCLTKKVKESLICDHPIIDEITSYLEKAKAEGRATEERLEFWKQTAERGKKNFRGI